jgi:hypothetical protein
VEHPKERRLWMPSIRSFRTVIAGMVPVVPYPEEAAWHTVDSHQTSGVQQRPLVAFLFNDGWSDREGKVKEELPRSSESLP